eukprot:bmy_20782T0
MPCAHWATASRALRTVAAPHGAWGRARCQGTWHRILRGQVAGRAGPLLCFPFRRPRAPTLGVFQDSEPVGPGIGCVLGGRGGTRKGGAGDMGCLCIQGPLGLLAGEDTWRPECWPGRVRALSTQPVPSSQGLGPVEVGREGRVGSGSSSSSSTHGGWQGVRRSVCRALHGAGGSGPLPSAERLPGRDQGHGWYRAVQWSAAMRSQESVRGSRWQGPESMGRGSRKVLRIWVDRVRPTETGAWQGCSPQGPGLAQNWVGGGHDPRVSPPPQAHSRCCGQARNDQGLELSPPTLLSPSDSVHWAGEAPWGPDKGAPETPFLLPDHRWVSGIPGSVAFWGPGAFSEDSGAASLVAMMIETGMGVSRAWHRGSQWAVAALVGQGFASSVSPGQAWASARNAVSPQLAGGGSEQGTLPPLTSQGPSWAVAPLRARGRAPG